MALGDKQFHESAEEIDRIRRRKEIRQKLKAEFNRLHYNPYKLAAHVEIVNQSHRAINQIKGLIF